MEQIVTKGIRIDLHIHSVFSKDKDGKKVQNNTLENLNLLPSNVQSTDRGAELCLAILEQFQQNLQKLETPLEVGMERVHLFKVLK